MSNAEHLGLQVLQEVKDSLGDDYAKLTDRQRLSIRDTAIMMMEKELALATEDDVVKKQEIKEQIQALESIVKDWKVWGEMAIEDAFWKGVQKVAVTFGSFLGAAAKAIIPL